MIMQTTGYTLDKWKNSLIIDYQILKQKHLLFGKGGKLH